MSAVLADPFRYFPGAAYVDGYGTTWYYWFVEQVLAGKQSLGHSDRLFFPWGKDIYLHTGGNLLDAALIQPLRWLFGPVLSYNLWIVLVFLTNAWGATRVAAALGVPAAQRWPAMVLVTLSPFVLQEVEQGRPTQAMLLFPALTLASLLDLSRWRDAVIAGLGLALSALTYWYAGLVLAALAVPLGLLRAISLGPVGLLRLVLAGGLALGLCLPVAFPMLQALEIGEVPGLLAMDGTGPLAPLAFRTEEGDAEGVFVLSLSGIGGSLFDVPTLSFRATSPLILPAQAAVVLVTLLLGRWRGLGWLLGGLLIATGPAWVIGSEILPNPVYLAVMSATDILRRWWWPARAVFVPTLVIAGLGAVAWAFRPTWAQGRLVSVLLGLGLVGSMLPSLHRASLIPFARWDGAGSPVLDCLARAPEGGLIDLPLVGGQENLYFQTLHQQPLLGGMLMKKPTFGPPELQALRSDNRFLAALIEAGDRQFTREPVLDEPGRLALLGLGYRYVLVRLAAYERIIEDRGRQERDSDWPRVRRSLHPFLGEPQAEDAIFAAYTLDDSPLDCAMEQAARSSPPPD